MGKHMQPLSRKARIILSFVVWLFLIPLLIGFSMFAWWFGAGLAAMLAWFTYDYIRRGDFAGDVEEGLSRGGGLFGKSATEVMGRDDKVD